MKLRKILGGFAWIMLTAVLIMANAMAESADGLFAKTEKTGVSSVMK